MPVAPQEVSTAGPQEESMARGPTRPKYPGREPSQVIPPALCDLAGPVGRTHPLPPGTAEVVEVRRAFPGVELWHVRDSTRLWTVQHTTYTFCVPYLMIGDQRWLYRRQRYALQGSHSTMLLEPGELHVTERAGAGTFYVLQVDPAVLASEFAGIARPPGRHFVLPQIDDPGLATAFLDLCRSLEDPDLEEFEQHAAFRSFLLRAFAHAGEAPPGIEHTGCERAVIRARAMLEDRHAERLSLDEIAAEVGVSKYHLERSFRARLGLPMHRYRKVIRIQRARALLAGGMRPAEVAETIGFWDTGHLYRAFREQMGLTPGAYFRGMRW